MPEWIIYTDGEPKQVLFIENLKARGMIPENIQVVREELDRICLHCVDHNYRCTCMNEPGGVMK